MRVPDLLLCSARAHPDRIAVTAGGRSITYQGLRDAALRAAAGLDRLSLTPGARVMLLLDNSIEYVIAYFAVLHCGLVVVPLDRSEHPAAIGRLAADCEAEAIICPKILEPRLPLILANGARPRAIISDQPLRGSYADCVTVCLDASPTAVADRPLIVPPPQATDLAARPPSTELAAIFYTSGSTGTPKGVMLSHRNLISNTRATVHYLGLLATDSVMVVLPFCYIYGNSLLLTHVAVGGRLAIDQRFLYPEVILDAMEEQRVTGFSGVPSHFSILLAKTTFASREFPDLRYLTQAGGALAPHLVRQLADAFPAKQVYVMYGQTEASPRVTWLPPERLADKIGSIGIPLPGVEIAIADEQGDPVAAGETGEIVVTGENVMLGYWRQPEETARVIRDGRLHTGDLARRDEDGFLHVIGRVKEMIKSGGNRVGAKEVEECLLRHDDVLEAAVIGVADEVLGEAIKALVVAKPGAVLSPDAVRDHCRKLLAPHKAPKYVVVVDALPRYPTGKVNRPRLIEQHG